MEMFERRYITEEDVSFPFGGYEPRPTEGMPLAYATSNCVAGHLRGSTYWAEIVEVPKKIDAITQEGTAKLAKGF